MKSRTRSSARAPAESRPSRKAAAKPRAVLTFETVPARASKVARSRFGAVGLSLLSRGVSTLLGRGGAAEAAEAEPVSEPASPRSGAGSAAASRANSEEPAGAGAAAATERTSSSATLVAPSAEERELKQLKQQEQEDKHAAAPAQAACENEHAASAPAQEREVQALEVCAAPAQGSLAANSEPVDDSSSSPTSVSTSAALKLGDGSSKAGDMEKDEGKAASIYIFKGKRSGPQPRKFDMFQGNCLFPDRRPACAFATLHGRAACRAQCVLLRCLLWLTLRAVAGYVLDPIKGSRRERLPHVDIQKWRRLVKAYDRILLSGSRQEIALHFCRASPPATQRPVVEPRMTSRLCR